MKLNVDLLPEFLDTKNMIKKLSQLSFAAAKSYKVCVTMACNCVYSTAKTVVNFLDDAMANAMADPHKSFPRLARVAKVSLPASINAQRKAAYGRLKRGRRIT